jgi:hypothetical protein
LVERLWRIVELSTADVGLAAVPGRIEDHWVNVDPPAALSDQLDTDWSPVGLYAIAATLQDPERHSLDAGVYRQVKVTV